MTLPSQTSPNSPASVGLCPTASIIGGRSSSYSAFGTWDLERGLRGLESPSYKVKTASTLFYNLP